MGTWKKKVTLSIKEYRVIYCLDQTLIIMLKIIADSKCITLFLNQVHHVNVVFDHDSDPSYPTPLMGLIIRRMLTLRTILPPNVIFDHNSDPGYPSLLMDLAISEMLALPTIPFLTPAPCIMLLVGIELKTLTLIPLVRINRLLLYQKL